MDIAASMPWQNIEYKACFELLSGMHIEASTQIFTVFVSSWAYRGLIWDLRFVTEVFLNQDPALLD